VVKRKVPVSEFLARKKLKSKATDGYKWSITSWREGHVSIFTIENVFDSFTPYSNPKGLGIFLRSKFYW
jgi:hypothetical protein